MVGFECLTKIHGAISSSSNSTQNGSNRDGGYGCLINIIRTIPSDMKRKQYKKFRYVIT